MLHLGDITKISGYTAPIVDCLIGGSPCQDLSVAGKRKGLAGERSGLFMEQIRIVKEMREREKRIGRTAVDVRPRYLVWENVYGALSSPGKGHAGEDFAAVLEEIIRIEEPEAPSISVPAKGWPTAGCIFDENGNWSVAWRVMDAQYWGVPQRRRRICLVADFNGLTAPRIVFGEVESHGSSEQEDKDSSSRHTGEERRHKVSSQSEGLSRDIAPGEQKGERASGTIESDFGTAVDGGTPYTLKIRSGVATDSNGRQAGKGALIQTDMSATLGVTQDQTLFQPVNWDGSQTAGTLTANSYNQRMPDKGNFSCVLQPVAEDPLCIEMTSTKNTIIDNGICPTLTARMGTGGNQVNAVLDKVGINGDVAGTLDASYYKGCGMREGKGREVVLQDSTVYRQGGFAQYVEGEAGTLRATSEVSSGGSESLVRTHHIVRRLTPLECERLQGFPDGWTDIGEWIDSKGKKHKEADSPRYRALGNSISLPPWKFVLKRLCACYERDATMASVFDGISGFPLLWTQLNGWGSVLWTSEIDEFPMAVCKRHFGDEETGEEGDFYEAILGRNKTKNV